MPGTKAGAAKRRAVRSESASPVSERTALPSAAEYECGNKPLKFGEITLVKGDPIPGAESWPRLESWIRTGRIVKR